MADIIIVKRRNSAVVTHDSPQGRKWIKDNIITTYGETVIIPADVVEDFIKNLERDEIDYEER